MPYDPLRVDYNAAQVASITASLEGRAHFDKLHAAGKVTAGTATLVTEFRGLDPITPADIATHLGNVETAIEAVLEAGAQLEPDLVFLWNIAARMATALPNT